jgi:hypothetical protein
MTKVYERVKNFKCLGCEIYCENDKGTLQNDKGTLQNDKGTLQNDKGTLQNDKGTLQKLAKFSQILGILNNIF